MANNLDLDKGDISKLLLEFSIPAIIGMSVSAFYNIVSRIFVGQGVTPLAIAAVTVAMPVMVLLFAVAMLIGIGATALISIRLGEQKKEEANKIAGNATLLLILLPLLFSIIYFSFSEPVLKLLGATSPDVLPYARDYIHIIMMGAVPLAVGFGLNNFIRAEGNPRFAMFTQIIGGVFNIILHYIFIFILGWGIKGAALAVITAQTISMIWVVSYFLRGTSRVKIKISNMKPQISIAVKIMAIGFAPFAMQIANSVQQTILNKTVLAYGGDLALAAVGIVMSVGMMLIMPIVGISQGAQPIIGYNYGARRYERVKETLKKGIMAATTLAVIGFIGIHYFATPVVSLFSKEDAALTELSAHAVVTFFTCLPVVGFQILGANFFQAVGKPLQSTILSLSRQVLIFIPLLLVLPGFWGIEGVWRTAPIADVLAVLLTAAMLSYEMKNIHQKPVLAMESN